MLKNALPQEIASLGNSGQVAAEFVLLLPYFCALLLVFIMFIVFCVRSQTATYAGFMAARVYNVWGDEEMVSNQLRGLLPESKIKIERKDDRLEVESSILSPFRFGIKDVWKFRTSVPVIAEPKFACVYEDNPLMDVNPENCL